MWVGHAWKCHWLCHWLCLPCITAENTHRLNCKQWIEKCEKLWLCCLHYGEGVNLGEEIFGLSHDTNTVISLGQDVGTDACLAMSTFNTAKFNLTKGTKRFSILTRKKRDPGCLGSYGLRHGRTSGVFQLLGNRDHSNGKNEEKFVCDAWKIPARLQLHQGGGGKKNSLFPPITLTSQPQQKLDQSTCGESRGTGPEMQMPHRSNSFFSTLKV